MRYHLTASASSSDTPSPFSYMKPTLNCASAYALVGSHAVPLDGFNIVFGHTLAVVVHDAQVELRVGVRPALRPCGTT